MFFFSPSIPPKVSPGCSIVSRFNLLVKEKEIRDERKQLNLNLC